MATLSDYGIPVIQFTELKLLNSTLTRINTNEMISIRSAPKLNVLLRQNTMET